MAMVPDATVEYASANAFRERCFTEHKSYLWPVRHVWTSENITKLLNAYMGRLDERSGMSFLKKWQDQLADQDTDVHRLAADVLAFYYLFPSSNSIRKIKKIEKLRTVISWKLQTEQPESDLLEESFGSGIGNVGLHYLTSQPFEIAYYLEFIRAAFERSIDFGDQSACRSLADEVRERTQDSSEARSIVLHLLFPQAFEPIVSMNHKKAIVGAFSQYADNTTDEDDSLRLIRTALTPEFGQDFSYYSSNVKPRWSAEKPTRQIDESPVTPEQQHRGGTIKSNLAYDYLRTLSPQFYKGKEEIWEHLRQVHPDVFDISVNRKTPWQTLNRDMREDPRFVFQDGAFALREWHLPNTDLDKIIEIIHASIRRKEVERL